MNKNQINTTLNNIKLNTISIQRKAINFDEAVAIWILHNKGEKHHIISAQFGTNQARIAEVLQGKAHPKAQQAALNMLSETFQKSA